MTEPTYTITMNERSALKEMIAYGHYDEALELVRSLTPNTGEAVAYVRYRNGVVDYDADGVISNTAGDCMDESIEWRPVFTSPAPSTSQPVKQPLATEREALTWALRKLARNSYDEAAKLFNDVADMLDADAQWKEKYLQVTAQTCRAEDKAEKLDADWSRFHHLMKKHGLHPGRTDDDLLVILDAKLSQDAQQVAVPQGHVTYHGVKVSHRHDGSMFTEPTSITLPAPMLPQAAQSPCDAGAVCLDCQPRNADGSCPDAKKSVDMRTTFERDFIGGGLGGHSLERTGDGYKFMPANVAWTTWQRAWNSSMQAKPTQTDSEEISENNETTRKAVSENPRHAIGMILYLRRRIEELKAWPLIRPERQPLTPEDLIDIMERLGITVAGPASDAIEALARAIEAAHGIKGATE